MAVTAQVNVKIDSAQASKTVGQLNQDVSNAAKSASSLKAELRQTIQELQNLQPGTARFQELSARAGELRDQIADTNAVVGQLAGNVTERLTRGITNVVSIGVAGFQTLAAGAALFGTENEELNETLIRLNALMNLSQAVETFAGLDQKLVEIRASFQSLTTATAVQTVAMEGEAVATTSATVATTALGTAMKALPIIALVAGLATLAYGLYQYATASSEADKNEKRRKANLEALKKAEKEQTETIAKESAEYVGLIYQLKATNADSKERETLIKQINATYGTTLKNLSDEKAFQQQLNLEVANYIAFQKAKFQLQKNEELVQKNLEKQAVLQKELTKAEALYNLEFNKKLGQDDLYAGQREQNLRDYQASITRIKGEIDAANKRLEAYGKVNLDVNSVIQEVTNNGKKYTDQTKNNTDATNDNTDALEKQKDALSNLRSLYDRQVEAEKQLEAIQATRIKTQISTIQILDEEFNSEIEKKGELIDYNEKFNLEIFNIEQSYRDKQANLVDQAIQREIAKYEESILGKKVSEKDYYEARKKIAENGVKNLLESELLLFAEFTRLSEDEIEEYTRAWTLKEQIAQDQTSLIQTEIEKLTLEFNRDQRIKDIENSQLTEEEKAKEILNIRKDFLANTTKLLEKERDNQIKVLEKQRDAELNNLDLTENEKLLITQKYNKQILEVNQNTQEAIQDETAATVEVQKSQLETLEDQLDTIDDYLAALQSLFADFESALTNVTEQNNERRTQIIQDSVNAQTQILDSQLQARLITQQEYDNKVLQLEQEQEQQQRELAKKSFQTNKKLNLVGATIDGARAVISTFANTPGELIIKSIAAALAGVFAATQIAVIARSQFTAADGGIVPGTNSGDIDSVSATLAPGEAVINSKSTSKFLPVLSAINQDGGGRSLMPNLPATNQGQKFEVVFPENKQMQPVRAYVVESDISDAQKRVQRIENSTRF
jgi:hypothetical protein